MDELLYNRVKLQGGATMNSFARGFEYGRTSGRELTAREIAEQFPDADVDVFAQGMLDGIAGDRYWLDDDDCDGPAEPSEPECIGSCDICGADVYDDEPRRAGSIRCDQCEWWAQQE